MSRVGSLAPQTEPGLPGHVGLDERSALFVGDGDLARYRQMTPCALLVPRGCERARQGLVSVRKVEVRQSG